MGTSVPTRDAAREEAVRREVRRLGLRVHALRSAAGLTQAEVASRAGLNRSVLSQIENGSYELGLGKVTLLAEALGVTPADLFEAAPVAPDR